MPHTLRIPHAARMGRLASPHKNISRCLPTPPSHWHSRQAAGDMQPEQQQWHGQAGVGVTPASSQPPPLPRHEQPLHRTSDARGTQQGVSEAASAPAAPRPAAAHAARNMCCAGPPRQLSPTIRDSATPGHQLPSAFCARISSRDPRAAAGLQQALEPLPSPSSCEPPCPP